MSTPELITIISLHSGTHIILHLLDGGMNVASYMYSYIWLRNLAARPSRPLILMK